MLLLKFARFENWIRTRLCALLRRDPVALLRIESKWPSKLIGSASCGWFIPDDIIRPRGVAYCMGAGEDVTFDIELARAYAMEVHTFDPTPRAIQHVQGIIDKYPNLIAFHPWGVWSANAVLKFYAPECPNHVSHSILNLQRTKTYFNAECYTLATIASKLHHQTIDLLKLDIEGAEYEVLASLLESSLRPKALLVEYDEFHHQLDRDAHTRIRRSLQRLKACGYQLYHYQDGNYCFCLPEPKDS